MAHTKQKQQQQQQQQQQQPTLLRLQHAAHETQVDAAINHPLLLPVVPHKAVAEVSKIGNL